VKRTGGTSLTRLCSRQAKPEARGLDLSRNSLLVTQVNARNNVEGWGTYPAMRLAYPSQGHSSQEPSARHRSRGVPALDVSSCIPSLDQPPPELE
jgi:hypothetical protein